MILRKIKEYWCHRPLTLILSNWSQSWPVIKGIYKALPVCIMQPGFMATVLIQKLYFSYVSVSSSFCFNCYSMKDKVLGGQELLSKADLGVVILEYQLLTKGIWAKFLFPGGVTEEIVGHVTVRVQLEEVGPKWFVGGDFYCSLVLSLFLPLSVCSVLSKCQADFHKLFSNSLSHCGFQGKFHILILFRIHVLPTSWCKYLENVQGNVLFPCCCKFHIYRR